MEKGICIGMIIGLAVGAVAVANCKKARQMIIDGQNKIMEKIDQQKNNQANGQENHD